MSDLEENPIARYFATPRSDASPPQQPRIEQELARLRAIWDDRLITFEDIEQSLRAMEPPLPVDPEPLRDALDAVDGALDADHPEGHDCDVCRAMDEALEKFEALFGPMPPVAPRQYHPHRPASVLLPVDPTYLNPARVRTVLENELLGRRFGNGVSTDVIETILARLAAPTPTAPAALDVERLGLSDEQARNLRQHLASRQQTLGEWISDVLFDFRMGRPNGIDYPPALSGSEPGE